MPQNDSQVETSQPAHDDGVPDRQAIQAAAAAEERRAADLIAQSRAAQEELPPPSQAAPEDESLISIMAQGRDVLMQRMREHAAQAEAKKNAYKPPPMTERQLAVLAEEQAAGQRARERHEQEQASRPPPPAKEVWDGTNTPVFRPGESVPDPTVNAPSGFVAGNRQFGADAP